MLTSCLYKPVVRMYTACDAMRIRSEILKYIIKHWKQNFVGTSALELADVFRLTHGEVVRRLKLLVSRGTVHLRSAQLGQPTKFREYKTDNGEIIRFPQTG